MADRLPDAFAVLADNSQATVDLVQRAMRQEDCLCVLIPHSRKDELWPHAVHSAIPWIDKAFVKKDDLYEPENLSVSHVPPQALSGVVVFTTGTMGRAKAVLYEWKAMKAQADATIAKLRLGEFELIAGTHIAHAYSLNAIFVAMNSSCKRMSTVSSPSSLITLIKDLAEGRTEPASIPSVLLASPAIYRLILADPAVTSVLIDWLYCAGCPLDASTHESFERRFGKRILQNYGSSETGNISFMAPSDLKLLQHSADLVGASTICEEGSVKLIPPAAPGFVLAPGYEGEICVKSSWTSLGYIQNGVLVPHPPYYRTGDMGRLKDGFLFVGPRLRAPITVVDHSSRLFVSLQPWQLEDAMLQCPDIKEVVVWPLKEYKLGALIVCGLPHQHIHAWMSQQLPAFAIPCTIAFATEIPRSAAGKVLYPKVQEMIESAVALTS